MRAARRKGIVIDDLYTSSATVVEEAAEVIKENFPEADVFFYTGHAASGKNKTTEPQNTKKQKTS